MSSIEDISGHRFGALVAVETVGAKDGQRLWRCECDCGGSIVAKTADITLTLDPRWNHPTGGNR